MKHFNKKTIPPILLILIIMGFGLYKQYHIAKGELEREREYTSKWKECTSQVENNIALEQECNWLLQKRKNP